MATTGSATDADAIIIAAGVLAALFAAYQAYFVSKKRLPKPGTSLSVNGGASYGSEGGAGGAASATTGLLEEGRTEESVVTQLHTVYNAISEGANAFLFAEYRYMAVFIVVFSVLVTLLVGSGAEGAKLDRPYVRGIMAAGAFAAGAIVSIVSGYVGMRIAVYANARVGLAARDGYTNAFALAFRSGSVMGFALTSMALLGLYVLILLYNRVFDWNGHAAELMDLVVGYGLGGSSIALFGRVGGGIYTKAADVGADLVGKVEEGIPEDDPRNPGTIADNVGDNVGDVAGMGSDLFGSFAESSCAALVVAANSKELSAEWGALLFPLLVSAAGIFVCFACSFIATHIQKVREAPQIEKVLKTQLWATTILLTPVLYGFTQWFLPETFCARVECKTDAALSSSVDVFWCVGAGLWAGLAIGLVTEYYTSAANRPVQEVAEHSVQGDATTIIYGLALGYKSVIIPVLALTAATYTSFRLCDMYGVAVAALGMLSSLSTGLAIDAYGPIADNAGGIVEMCGFGHQVRDRTDALDAAGNTTAAIGKGFAIGSAALVSLALFGAFVTRSNLSSVDVLQPLTFCGLLVGAMLPYWFSALTVKSVGIAASTMVDEIRSQFKDGGIMAGTKQPDYQSCVDIATTASLREMIAPGLLVILSPIVVGGLFGPAALTGLLAGGLVSGVQMAISASNTGGAWDNAKKYIEAGPHEGADERLQRGTDAHKAAITGDTVGDPLKDTSGPALNILMKLMAVIALVCADFFTQVSPRWGETHAV